MDKKKGIEEILRAWKYLEKKYLDWELLLCGHDNKYKSQMINLASDLKLKKVSLEGQLKKTTEQKFEAKIQYSKPFYI